MTSAKGRGKPRDQARRNHPAGEVNHKHMESDRISEHIAAFEREGGRVEKLGTTRVLQKIEGPAMPVVVPPKRKR